MDYSDDPPDAMTPDEHRAFREREALRQRAERAEAEIALLRADVARMRPVFDAAQRLVDDAQPSLDALVDAVERAQ